MVKKGIKRTLARARSTQDRAQNKMLKELAKDVSQLKASVEKKYSYLATEGVSVQPWDPSTTASRSQNIFPIRIGSTQGTADIDERIGDIINLKSIDFRYNLQLINGASNPADSYNRIRVILFWDTDPVETNASGSYIIDSPEWNLIFQTPSLTSGAGIPMVVMSPKDHDTGKRFQLLHDKTHTLSCNVNSNLSGSGSSLGLGPRSVSGVEYVNKHYKVGRKLQYKGGGTIPINRHLYIGFISDSLNVVNPSADFTIKCLYEDA